MESLVGSWDLIGTYRQRGDGGCDYYLGRNPRGRLTYTNEGFMHAIMISDTRPQPTSSQLSTSEKVEMFDTLIAYSGTYRVEDRKVTHHVDAAWNEAWIGRDKVRFFELNEGRLAILTEPTPDPKDGSSVVYVVEWQRSRTAVEGLL